MTTLKRKQLAVLRNTKWARFARAGQAFEPVPDTVSGSAGRLYSLVMFMDKAGNVVTKQAADSAFSVYEANDHAQT